MRQCFVARDVDFPDFGLLFLIHIDSHFHIARVVLVSLLQDLYFRIVVTFLSKILLYHGLCVVGEVGCHLAAVADTYFHLHIFFLALFQSVIYHLRYPRTLLQRYLQPYLLPLNLLGFYLHIREEALLPETLYRLGYLVPGHLYLIAHSQSGKADEHEVLVTVRAGNAYPCYLVGLALIGVFYLRQGRIGAIRCHYVRYRISHHLRPQSACRQHAQQQYIYISTIRHLLLAMPPLNS